MRARERERASKSTGAGWSVSHAERNAWQWNIVAACDAATATAKLFRLINIVGCAAECFDWIKLIELVSYIFLGNCPHAELFL